MSRPRQASVESRMKLHALEKKVEELEDFKQRIELGQKWLLCAVYAIGGIVGFVGLVLQIVKDWPRG